MAKRLRTAAVVAARDGDRIPRIITEFRKLPVDEVYVVCCGFDERTTMTARRQRARIVETHASSSDGEAIALGVSQSPGADAYLCIDGRYVYPAEWLRPYVDAVSKGADVVLNDVASVPVHLSRRALCAAFLNCASHAFEDGANSLTVFPFCLSRQAVNRIGCDVLAALPSALLCARLAELRIEAVGPVPSATTDPYLERPESDSGATETESPGHFDAHLVALLELIAARGPRGAFSDRNRRRDLLYKEGSR